MKEDKHNVFVLKSTKNKDGAVVDAGYLLFPEESKAENYLEICSRSFSNGVDQTSGATYSKVGYMKVNDFYAGMVDNKGSFYVGNIQLTQEGIENN